LNERWQRLGYLAGQEFDGHRPEGKPDSHRGVTDRLDEHHVFARQPGGFRQPTIDGVLLQQPGHRDGYRRLVAGRRAQVLQFLKAFAGDRFMDPKAVGTRQCSRSNTHSQLIRVVGRQHVGYPSSALPAHIRRGDITSVRPLDELSTIGPGNSSASKVSNWGYDVVFTRGLANQNVPSLVADASNLGGGTVTVTTLREGASPGKKAAKKAATKKARK
jgi:hypothetical protein